MEQKEKILSTILLVARNSFQASILKRITSHLCFKQRRLATDIAEAETEIMRKKPNVIFMDVSDFKSGEFQTKLEPFLLSLPGWIRTFFVDANPTVKRIKKAADLGVNGILSSPLSHHGVTTLLKEVEGNNTDSAKEKLRKDLTRN